MKAQTRKILLTIGMIVKNEEKYLEGCLKALQPLRDAVPSELIITDTGSTDRTIEIAQQYADQVLFFEWNNNFSDARNVALKAARGEWFLYLDADEWLDDPAELVAFLKKSPKSVENASIVMRNYSNEDGSLFQDFTPARLVRNRPEYHFVGKVHELIPVAATPVNINTLVHHYGYQDRDAQLEKSKNRNLPLLLEMLEETTPDVHLYMQLARECASVKEVDRALEFSLKAIEAAKKEPLPYFSRAAHHDYFNLMFVYSMPDRLLEEAPAYYESVKDKPCTSDIDAYYMLAVTYFEKNRHQEAAETCKQYFHAVSAYEKNELDTGDMDCVALIYNGEPAIQTMIAVQTSALKNLGRFAEALKNTYRFDFTVINKHTRVMFEILLICAAGADVYQDIVWLYQLLSQPQASDEIKVNFELFKQVWEETARKYPKIIYGVAPLMEKELPDDFFGLMLRLHTANAKGEMSDELIQKAFSLAPKEDPMKGVILGYAIKWKKDLTPFIQTIKLEEAAIYLKVAATVFPEIAQYISDYYLERPLLQDLDSLRWEIYMSGQALTAQTDNQDKFLPLFERYCRNIGNLTFMLFNASFLNADLCKHLPITYRFGYWSNLACKEKDKGNIPGYLKMLERAGEEYPVYLPYVKASVTAVKDDLERQKAKDQEAERIRAQVKALIRNMIAKGQFVQAQQALDSYTKIAPNDEEILSLRLQIENKGIPS